jgi:hypothetical protein
MKEGTVQKYFILNNIRRKKTPKRCICELGFDPKDPKKCKYFILKN